MGGGEWAGRDERRCGAWVSRRRWGRRAESARRAMSGAPAACLQREGGANWITFAADGFMATMSGGQALDREQPARPLLLALLRAHLPMRGSSARSGSSPATHRLEREAPTCTDDGSTMFPSLSAGADGD